MNGNRCEIKWCAALPEPGQTACVVHRKYPHLHPQAPEVDNLTETADHWDDVWWRDKDGRDKG